MFSDFCCLIEKELSGECLLQKDVPLASLLTFRAGGSARLLVSPRTVRAMAKVLGWLYQSKLPFHLLGGGSNTLPPAGDYGGVLISSREMKEAYVSGSLLYAEGGALLPALAALAAKHSLSGLEELSGIPGSLGGALYMNAGAYGKCIGDVVQGVIVYDPKTLKSAIYNRAGSFFSYRDSIFRQRKFPVLGAVLALSHGRRESILERRKECMERRRESQPLSLPGAGSIFRAPAGLYAGRLIEEAGLKGAGIGGAVVSQKHAGFVVNAGGAAPEEICLLISLVREKVFESSGVLLSREVEYFEEGVGRTCPIQAN